MTDIIFQKLQKASLTLSQIQVAAETMLVKAPSAESLSDLADHCFRLLSHCSRAAEALSPRHRDALIAFSQAGLAHLQHLIRNKTKTSDFAIKIREKKFENSLENNKQREKTPKTTDFAAKDSKNGRYSFKNENRNKEKTADFAVKNSLKFSETGKNPAKNDIKAAKNGLKGGPKPAENNSAALVFSAGKSLRAKKYGEALGQYRRAVAVDAAWARVAAFWGALGMTFLALENEPMARAAFEKCLALGNGGGGVWAAGLLAAWRKWFGVDEGKEWVARAAEWVAAFLFLLFGAFLAGFWIFLAIWVFSRFY